MTCANWGSPSGAMSASTKSAGMCGRDSRMKRGIGAGDASRRNGDSRGEGEGNEMRMEGDRATNMRGDRTKGTEVG